MRGDRDQTMVEDPATKEATRTYGSSDGYVAGYSLVAGLTRDELRFVECWRVWANTDERTIGSTNERRARLNFINAAMNLMNGAPDQYPWLIKFVGTDRFLEAACDLAVNTLRASIPRTFRTRR